MRVVLINAPYLDVYGTMNVGRNHTFSLGLGYLAAVLRDAGHEVNLLDPEPVGMDERQVADYVREREPRLVGVSCATPNFRGARRIGQLVREVTPAPIVLGGIHVSALPRETLKQNPQFDMAAIGEGEQTVRELCEALESDAPDLSAVNGLMFRRDGEFVQTPPRQVIRDLDSLPFPARDLVDLNLYRPQVHLYRGRKSATLITSRGCPAGCTFCATHVTMGKRFRFHSAEYVVAEVELLARKYGVRDLVIVDDTFTIKKDRVRKICELLIQKNLKVGWFCFVRVNDASEELFRLMKRAGCYSVFFGVESADPQVLRNIKKGATVEQARQALRIANRLGFKTEAGFMFGNPGDTRETMRKTVRLALELSPVIGSFNIMTPYPGTEEYARLREERPDLEFEWDNVTPKSVEPIIQIPGVTTHELQRLISGAFLKFYLRPGQALRMLRNISSFRELFVYVRGGLGILSRVLEWRKASRKGSDTERAHTYFEGLAPDYDLAFSGKGSSFYARTVNRLFRRHTFQSRTERIVALLKDLAIDGKHVLDFGCGSGQLAVESARLGARVTALDISSAMLEIARSRAEAVGVRDRLELVLHDGQTAELPECDVALLVGVLEYYEDYASILRRVCEKTRGSVIVCHTRGRLYRRVLRKILGWVKKLNIYYHPIADMISSACALGFEVDSRVEESTYSLVVLKRKPSPDRQ